MLKVHGKVDRLRKTVEALRRLSAEKADTVCVCQEDPIREKLSTAGFNCVSYADEVDSRTESDAWVDAIQAKGEVSKLLRRTPLMVMGYDCTDVVLGGTVDRFAFLSTALLLRNKLAKRGYGVIILIPSQEYADQLPEMESTSYRVYAVRDVKATFRHFWKILALYLFPLLAVARLRLILPLYKMYATPSALPLNSSSPRVLIVVEDRIAFPAFYSPLSG